MKTKRCSLRMRLLRMLVLPLTGAFLFIGAASYYSSYHEAEEIYDAQLTHFAKVLFSLTIQDIASGKIAIKRINTDGGLDLHEYEKNFAYRVWLANRLILYSSNSEDFGPATQSEGFTERMIGESRWRFFVLLNGPVRIEVAERYEIREDLIEHIIGGIFLPQLLIIPLFGLIIWLGVARGITPLDTLSNIIRNRDPNKLTPISAPIIPKEITPVLDAINDLMKRTAHVLEHEKQFSNYAAHELRTPLAALKTQLQVALRTKDEQKARQLFEEMLPATERMQNLVDQLLTFVRVQRTDSTFGALDFSALCEKAMREAAAIATKTHRSLECDIAPAIQLHGNEEMLAAMLRNLLDNALKYTRTNGHVLLTLSSSGAGIRLTVQDDGIGLPDKDRERIFDSFYRAADTHAEGSGLGLTIVKWVAEAHHATLSITTGINGKGACFEVLFPNPQAENI